MSIILLAIGIVLTIVCLVVRDQTEFRLSRLRAELMALRSEEQRLNEERTDLERMISQAGEALIRAERRQLTIEKESHELIDLLEEMGVSLEEEAPDAEAVEQQDQAGA